MPQHDDPHLFEMLILEGAQAGLSWLTILKRREGYREAFAQFDAAKVARFNENKVEKLMKNPAIIRNRLKIESTISNARAYLAVQKEFGSFDRFIWSFIGGKPIVNRWKKGQRLPASTPVAETMSRELKKRGFRFVGPTICYAYMQAVGMVNDHTLDCFCAPK